MAKSLREALGRSGEHEKSSPMTLRKALNVANRKRTDIEAQLVQSRKLSGRKAQLDREKERQAQFEQKLKDGDPDAMWKAQQVENESRRREKEERTEKIREETKLTSALEAGKALSAEADAELYLSQEAVRRKQRAKADKEHTVASEKYSKYSPLELHMLMGKNGVGNIDRYEYPKEISIADGEQDSGISGVESYVHKNDSGIYVVIPAVAKNSSGGWSMIDRDTAVENFNKKKKYFGAFNSGAEALEYADILQKVHRYYYDNKHLGDYAQIDFSDKKSLEKTRNDIYNALTPGAEKDYENNEWLNILNEAFERHDGTYNDVEYNMQNVLKVLDNVLDGTDKRFNDDFFGQFGASYSLGKLEEDKNEAWNKYGSSGDAADFAKAKLLSGAVGAFAENNSDTLDEDATLPWLSQSLAGYLPQAISQAEAGLGYAIPISLGAAVTTRNLKTAADAAGKAYSFGVGEYNYEQVAGAALEKLLKKGYTLEEAIDPANQEALISAISEAIDVDADIGTFGKFIKNPKAGAIKALAGLGINVLAEGEQERFQEALSLANENRGSSGILNLLGETVGVYKDAYFDNDKEYRERLGEAAAEGRKISLMLGGVPTAVKTGKNVYDAVRGKADLAEIDDVLYNQDDEKGGAEYGDLGSTGRKADSYNISDDVGAESEFGQGRSSRNGTNDSGDGNWLSSGQRVRAKLRPTDNRWSDFDYIEETDTSARHVRSRAAEYGIECFIVNDKSWENNKITAPVYSKNGQIYIRENVDKNRVEAYVKHEVTHIMKQVGYIPYLQFVEKIPNMLNMSSGRTMEVLQQISKHRDIEVSEMPELEQLKLYDEFNAMVYGSYVLNRESGRVFLTEVLHDPDSYLAEMDKLHEDFKAQNKAEINRDDGKKGGAEYGREGYGAGAGDRTSGAEIYGESGRKVRYGGRIPQIYSDAEYVDIDSGRGLGKDLRWSADDYIKSDSDSVMGKVQKDLAEYGIKSYVISSKAWGNKYNSQKDAYTQGGEVYLKGDLEPVLKTEYGDIEISLDLYAKSIAEHEGTHVLRQRRNPQYISFLKRFSEMLDIENVELVEEMTKIAKEQNIDVSIYGQIGRIDSFDRRKVDKVLRVYDELNARIYGTRALDEDLAEVVLSQFFIDKATYHSYLAEMDKLHEDFKAQNKAEINRDAEKGGAEYGREGYGAGAGDRGAGSVILSEFDQSEAESGRSEKVRKDIDESDKNGSLRLTAPFNPFGPPLGWAEKQIASAESALGGIGESGQRAFRTTYTVDVAKSLDAGTAVEAFTIAYNASLNGNRLTPAQEQKVANLPRQMSYAAQAAGQNDANKAIEKISATGQMRDLDAGGNPLFVKNKDELNLEYVDFAERKKKMTEASAKYGLRRNESSRLDSYVKGGLCYILNERMYSGTELTTGEQEIVDSIRNALLKMPEYSGRAYRNIKFETKGKYDAFLRRYSKGNEFLLEAFTSTSKLPNGYPKFGNGVVHIIIDGVSGKDISNTFGYPRQQEVVYLPGTKLRITDVVTANDKNVLIYAAEVKENEWIAGETGKNIGNKGSEKSVYSDLDRQEFGDRRDGIYGGEVYENAQRGILRNGVLSKRRKGADGRDISSENDGRTANIVLEEADYGDAFYDFEKVVNQIDVLHNSFKNKRSISYAEILGKDDRRRYRERYRASDRYYDRWQGEGDFERDGEKNVGTFDSQRSDARRNGQRSGGVVSQKDKTWKAEDYVTAKQGSVASEIQGRLKGYGIESYVIDDAAWEKSGNKYPIYSKKEQIYMRETLNGDEVDSYVFHEITHIMKQSGFAPYIEFVKTVPQLLNMSNRRTTELLSIVAAHRQIDISNMTSSEEIKLYDELCATLYGSYLIDSNFIKERYSEAFDDFDFYIAKIEQLHYTFKKERGEQNVGLGRYGRSRNSKYIENVETERSKEELRYRRSSPNGESNGRNASSAGQRSGGIVSPKDKTWKVEDYVTAKQGSVASEIQGRLKGYGIESYVIDDAAWEKSGNKYPIYSKKEQIYMRETLNGDEVDSYVFHEITHIMKQSGFAPYIEFVKTVPQLLNMSSKTTQRIISIVAERRGLDISEMSENALTILFDELIATAYSDYHYDNDMAIVFYADVFQGFRAFVRRMAEMQKNFKYERNAYNGRGKELSESSEKANRSVYGRKGSDAEKFGEENGRKTFEEYGQSIRRSGGKGTEGEEIHIRKGSEWSDSENTGRQIRELEKGTGRAESRNEKRKPADRGAAALILGEKVSVASLGIVRGSRKESIRLVSGGETKATKAAKALAKERGLRLILFAGDNMTFRGKNGKEIRARAYISKDRVFVRADHPDFTAEQLMRHEAGHDMIAKGEIDLNAVRERIGAEKVARISKLYAIAYEGSELSAEEIFEEIVCDALGDMNIFAASFAESEVEKYLGDTSAAVAETKTEPQRGRAPPIEMFSRGTKSTQQALAVERRIMENNRYERLRQFHEDLPSQWFAFTEDSFYIYSNKSQTDYTVLGKVKITEKNKNAIDSFVRGFENGVYDSVGVFDSWTLFAQGGKGRNYRHNGNVSERGAAGRNDGLAVRESKRRYVENIEKNSRNSEENLSLEIWSGTAAPIEMFSREYWYPKLNKDEWDLLNRTLDKELDSNEKFITDSVKWLYASDRGKEVFAIYGIGDGTEATVLYASGTRYAWLDSTITDELERELQDGIVRGTKTYSRRIKTLRRRKGRHNSNGIATENRGSAVGNAGLFGNSSRESTVGRSDNGKSAKNSEENFSLEVPSAVAMSEDDVGKFSRDLEKRRRALKKGEMINEFRNKINWRKYYEKLKSTEYNSDFYDDGEIAYMELDGMILELKMLSNGEFSVIGIVEDYNEEVRENNRISESTYGETQLSGERERNRDVGDKIVRKSGISGRTNETFDRKSSTSKRSRKSGTVFDTVKKGNLGEIKNRSIRYSESAPLIDEDYSVDTSANGISDFKENVNGKISWEALSAVATPEDDVGKFSRDLEKRRRALEKGEMINEFRNKINWRKYYEKLKSTEYNSDFYDDGETTYMKLDGYVLKLKMNSNGEFSVIERRKDGNYGRTDGNSAIFGEFDERTKLSGIGTGYGNRHSFVYKRTFENGETNQTDSRASGDTENRGKTHAAPDKGNGGRTSLELKSAVATPEESRKKTQSEGEKFSIEPRYSGENVEWAIDDGIISEQERIAFFHSIANINKLGEKVRRTEYGGYIIDIGNKLLFTDGDWYSPSLSSIVVFDDISETSMERAKDVIFNGKNTKAGYEKSRQIIEATYWPGYVERYDRRNSFRYEWENSGREGVYSSRADKEIRKRRTSLELKSAVATPIEKFSGENQNTHILTKAKQKFQAEIDAWDGKENKTFNVGVTSDVLAELGVARRPIVWHSPKIAKILKKHDGMSRNVIKQVPEIIENPVVILKSQQSDSRITMFGELTDENGAPIIVALELQPSTSSGRLLNINIIVSAYGKDSNPSGFIKNSEILYLDVNRKRTQSLLHSLGLQLPLGTTTLGSIGTVTYVDGKVNIHGVPYEQYMQDDERNSEKTFRETPSAVATPIEKFSRDLEGKTFPPYHLSQSDTNERAIRWANSKEIEIGDLTIMFYHMRPYLIEKVNDTNLQYRILKSFTKKEYSKYIEKVRKYEEIGRWQSVGKSTIGVGELNSGRNFDVGRESGSSSLSSRYGGESNNVQRMGENEDNGRQISGDRSGGLSGSGKNKPSGGLKVKTFRETSTAVATPEEREILSEVRKSMNRYTYDRLVSKPDMKITEIDDSVMYAADSVTRKWIVQTALNNAKQVGKTNSRGEVLVYVEDIGESVMLSTHGLQHGLDRRLQKNAAATIRAGEILKNAICINELTPQKSNIDGSYVLLGIAKNMHGELYITEFVINKYNNELQTVDVLYSLNSKKEESAVLNAPAIAEKPLRITDSKISIADLLELSIRHFPDILPGNILMDFGYNSRPEGKSALYSRETSTAIATPEESEILSEVQESVRATVREELERMGREYGWIPKGEKAEREVRLPQKTADNKYVSHTVRTIAEAKATHEEMLPDIEEMVANGEFSYDRYTDKAAIADAENSIRKKGWKNTLFKWLKDCKDGKISKKNTALGWALYNNAVNSNDIETALEILNTIVANQHSAAQVLQATRILKKLSPEKQLFQVQKSIAELQEEIVERYGSKKCPQLEISKSLAEKFLKAETQKERDEVLAKIYADIGRQMPAHFGEKWKAWRYLAMLANPRTHVRNIAGNAVFAPVVITKDLTATAIEAAVYRVSGKRLSRTKALGKNSAKALAAAWGDYKNVADIVSNGGKFNDEPDMNKYIQEGRKILPKPLDAVRKFNNRALEIEDMCFSMPHYAFALAQYAQANGISPEQIKKGDIPDAARAYAILEAQKATYRDTNELSGFLKKRARETGEHATRGKVINTVVDGALPFRGTPANILVRVMEYSPLGLMYNLTKGVYDVARGKKTGAELIDGIAAGLTGTGIMAFGIYCAAERIVRGCGGYDDAEKEFEEMLGHQAYSLELPDGTSVTLDWLAPGCLPFFVGVNLWEMSAKADEPLTFSALLDAVSMISDPMLEMSCLQSVNALFESIGYASSNDLDAISTVTISAATSFLTQAFPTLLGQAERSSEDVRYTTYTEKDAFLTSDMQYTLGKVSSKIPGWDYQQIPYIDEWGETEENGEIGERLFNNFLNPAYTSDIDESAMEKELLRLYNATGEKGVLPKRAEKSLKFSERTKHLTAREYVKYATKKGKSSRRLLEAITESREYKKASDGDKVKLIEAAYEYAGQTAKAEFGAVEYSSWVKNCQKAEDFEISADTFIILNMRAADIKSMRKKNGDVIRNSRSLLIMQMVNEFGGLTEKQRKFLYESFNVGEDVINYNKNAVKKKLERLEKMRAG